MQHYFYDTNDVLFRKILDEDKPQFFLRADIKSYYKSICHFKLINSIKQHYDDPNVQNMLIEIIKNPIETPRGYKNSDTHYIRFQELNKFNLHFTKLSYMQDHFVKHASKSN